MFKTLRNKLLIVNTVIIASLLLGSFSLIYITTYRNTARAIDEKLNRSINFALNDRMTPDRDTRRAGTGGAAKERPPMPAPDEQFTLSFSVTADADGHIERINMPFELNDDFYTDKLPGIVSSSKERGQIKASGDYWTYRYVRAGGQYIVAFTQTSSETGFMRSLLLALIIIAVIALALAFIISLLSANRSIRPVEETYNKQKQFVADASHELKTPLTTINTNVDVLLSHEESTIREERKWLDYIKTEAERMTKLTNDLLYLARLDHGENALMLSRVSFSEAAESVILLMEAVIFEKNVNMTYDIQPGIFVKGSSEQLKQLVMILLDNAVKYTPKKGDIRVRLYKDASDAVFTVRNTGEGISEDSLEHIFERFYREDKSRARKSGGYGLGLAIARAIVTSYKGSIHVSSEKNKYTKFTVKLTLIK